MAPRRIIFTSSYQIILLDEANSIHHTNNEKHHYKCKVWVFNQSWFHSPVNVAVTVSDDKIWQPMKTFTHPSLQTVCYIPQVKCSSSSTLFNHVYIHLSFCQIGTSLQFNFSSSSEFRVENVQLYDFTKLQAARKMANHIGRKLCLLSFTIYHHTVYPILQVFV